MNIPHWLKIAVVGLIALQVGASFTHAQTRGVEAQVYTSNPAGLVKKINPEYPPGIVLHGAKGKGVFRLTINPKSGLVDEVKIVKSCGYEDLNKLAAKALLQWTFQPGTHSPVEVPVEFDIRGGSRVLH
jgi:TonB family protein